jgi:hypothetical protein
MFGPQYPYPMTPRLIMASLRKDVTPINYNYTSPFLTLLHRTKNDRTFIY